MTAKRKTTSKAAPKKAPAKKKTVKKTQSRRKPQPRDEYGLTSKEREVADLYRGGSDDIRGVAWKCYKEVHPRVAKRTAEVEGAKLINKPEIKDYLAEKAEQVGKEADITQDRVLREVARIGLFDPRKLFHGDGSPKAIQDLDDDTVAAIAGLKVVQIGNADVGVGAVLEYKLADKNNALEKLMKHLGAYEKDNKQKSPFEGLSREVLELIAEKLRGAAG